MKYFGILSFLFFIISSGNLWANDCDIKNIEEQLRSARQTLQSKNELISELLKGNIKSGQIVSNIFGHEYHISKIKTYVQEIDKTLVEDEGLGPEYRNLHTCLVESNKLEKANGLALLNQKFLKLKKELFLKDYQLGGSLKEGLEAQVFAPSLIERLKDQNKISNEAKLALEKSLLKNEHLLNVSEKNLENKEFASFVGSLTKVRISLLETKLRRNTVLEKEVQNFEMMTKELAKIASSSFETKQQIKDNFESVETIWTKVTNENFYKLNQTKFNFELPEVPNIPINSALNPKQRTELIEMVKSLSELKSLTYQELSEKKKEEVQIFNQLLEQVNTLRTNIYLKFSLMNSYEVLFSSTGMESLKDEVSAFPQRLFSSGYDLYFYMQEIAFNGKSGYIKLFYDLCKIILAIFFIFTFDYLIKELIGKLGDKLKQMAFRYRKSSLIKSASSSFHRIRDNLRPLLWLIVLFSIEKSGSLEEVEFFIRIAEILLVGKLIKSFVTLFLGLVTYVDFRNFSSFMHKAENSAEKFQKVYLSYTLSMIFVEMCVGKVYIYSLVKLAAASYVVFQIIRLSNTWEQEFYKFIETRCPGFIKEKIDRVINILPQKLRSIFIFTSILIISILNLIIQLTENLDISKKISANVFKKQIEGVESTEIHDEVISEDYSNLFNFNSLELGEDFDYVNSSPEDEKKITVEVEEWLEEKSTEHCLVIYGDKGIGKTTILKHTINELKKEKEESFELKYVKLPSKVTDKVKLKDFLIKCFDSNQSQENFDLYQIDRALEKKVVVIIDEAQNSFLSKTGGFKAYSSLVDMVNFNTKNIFWVMSFNKYSWLYIDRAFGRTQFFRNVIELKGWSDDKIKELIMKRHRKSQFKLSYDILINATHSHDEIDKYTSVESKFFKLLWEMSRGNPRAALKLWLTALSLRSNSVLTVNVPKDIESGFLAKSSDDLMFVISTVLRHENLSFSEIEETTNLPRGIVRNALKVGMERELFYKDKRERYMIDIVPQYNIGRYLKLRNFIYGG